MSESCDVVIVGGGLAGMSMAVMLSALTDYSITLLERRPMKAIEQPDPLSRPISLAHATVSILKALGVWVDLASVASPISRVLVSQAGALGGVHFSADDWEVDALGQVVPIDYIVASLWQALSQSDVRVLTQATVTHLDQQEEGVMVRYADADQVVTSLHSRCVIAADGASSPLRSLLPIEIQATGSPVTIVVAEAECDAPHEGQAEQRFVPGHGVLASVPMCDPKRVRIIWTRRADDSDEFAQCDDEAYLRWCQAQFKGRLSLLSLTRHGQFSVTPQSANTVTDGRVVLLGDAARTIPPLAAQGFNLTVSDAAALVETMVQADKTVPGSGTDPSTFQRYARWRHRANDRLPRFLHASQTVFASPLPGLSGVRSKLLLAIDLLPGVRRLIGKRLLGLAGRVPALARGVSVSELKASLLCHDQ